MRFNLISNLANGVGLERDYRLLRAELEKLGHEVNGVQFNGDKPAPDADINIFLEVVAEKYFESAKYQWVVPNAEWWFKGWDASLNRFEWVLCKTRHCETLFSKKARTKYLGWKSQDFYDPQVPRVRKILHLAGKSQTKNSEAILNCWRHLKPPADLTIVSQHYNPRGIQRTQHFARVTDEQLSYLMNSHQIHLMPSAYEGWGHALHEAMGVGAAVITTDAPPMNEIGTEFVIPVSGKRQHHAAELNTVNPQNVFHAVNTALKHNDAQLHEFGKAMRERFLDDNADFESRLLELAGRA